MTPSPLRAAADPPPDPVSVVQPDSARVAVTDGTGPSSEDAAPLVLGGGAPLPPIEAKYRLPLAPPAGSTWTYSFTGTSDWSGDPAGDTAHRGTVRYLLQADCSADLGAMLGWSGASLYARAERYEGANGSERVGDLQGFSNMDGELHTQIAELFLEQYLAGGAARLKFGKADANGDFAYVDGGVEFVNSSMGCSPTILGLPTYPDPATALVAEYGVDRRWSALAGVYDGAAQSGVQTGQRGPSTFLGEPDDLFYAFEVRTSWNFADRGGRLGCGGWHHTGDFSRFDGASEHGATGTYLVFDQAIGASSGFFLQAGLAPAAVSEVTRHLGGGLTRQALWSKRPDDVTGIGLTQAAFSDDAGFAKSSELALEMFHKIQVTEFLSLKPDFQVVWNSGGSPERATIALLRSEISL